MRSAFPALSARPKPFFIVVKLAFKALDWTRKLFAIASPSRKSPALLIFFPDESETIEYSVVDEHDGKFNLWTEWSDKPFSLSELVEFIDRTELEGSSYSGLSLSFNNSNAECMDKEDLVGFTTISSEIYPDLEDHYGKVFTEWAGVEVLEETRQ